MEEQNNTGRAKRGKGPAKRTPSIEIKLSAGDYIKFSELCRLEKKNRTEVARAAILRYIDKNAQEQADEARDRLAAILEEMHLDRKKDTERIVKLVVRTLIDIGTVQQVFFERASKGPGRPLDQSQKASIREATEEAEGRRSGSDGDHERCGQ